MFINENKSSLVDRPNKVHNNNICLNHIPDYFYDTQSIKCKSNNSFEQRNYNHFLVIRIF